MKNSNRKDGTSDNSNRNHLLKNFEEKNSLDNSNILDLYKKVLDNMKVGIFIISPNMEILYLNNQMKKWFPDTEVSIKTLCFNVFKNSEDICEDCPACKTFDDGNLHEAIGNLDTADGATDLRIISFPIENDKGDVVAALEMVENISPVKQMEDELKTATASLNSIFEGPENIIAFSLDKNYRYMFFNQAHRITMKNIWGVDIEIGKSMLDYISYLEDRDKAKVNFDRAISGESFIELEDYGEESLSRRYWENIYNPIQSGKEIIGLSVFCIDITERQEAEETLKQSEEKFRAVAESAIDAIITTDSNGIITYINQSLLELFGYTEAELKGKSVSLLIPENHRNGHMDGMKSFKTGKLRRTGKTSRAIGLKKNGTKFPCEMSLSIWKLGNDTYFTSIIRDLSDRVRSEEALKESEEKFKSIFNNANDMISLNIMNENGLPGRFLEVNNVATERLGYTREEFLKMSPREIVAPDKHHEMPGNAKILLEKGHNTFEILHLAKNGKKIFVEVNNHLINYKGQQVCLAITRDITERKRTDKALKESEEKYRTIFENVQDICFQTDIKGTILEISPSVEKYFGVTPKQLIGLNVDRLYNNPEYRKNLLKTLEEEKEVTDYEITIKDKEDNLRYISANAHFIFDSNNNPVGVEGALRDITERKNAEEELKLSQMHLANAMEMAHMASWTFTFPEMIFTFNDSFYSLYGTNASREGGYMMTASDYVEKFVHPDDAPNIADGFKLMQETGEPGFPEEVEHRIVRGDGKTRYIVVRIQLLWDENGKLIGGYGTNQDITERKVAEEILKSNEIRLANAMDLAHLASWELDISSRMFLFNDRFYSMFGTTAVEEGGYYMSIEEYLTKYVHPEDAQSIGKQIQQRMQEALEGESVFGYEHRIIRADGEIRYMAVRVRVVGEERHNVYVYGFIQDITERKIAEQKLHQSLEEKEMLIKEIHHRVKNNLMVISSLLNLQSQYIKDKEALDIFKESQNRAKSMALIHERLYRSTDLKKIDFGDYIETLANDLFHTYIQDPSLVKLNMNVENVMVDINTTVPLGLIVNELVTNSMKHAFPNGRKGEINIDFHKEGKEFVLSVNDTGVGLPEDIDFRYTDTLGLQLVNNLVEQIDGTITLDTSHGTEFKIVFEEVEYKRKV